MIFMLMVPVAILLLQVVAAFFYKKTQLQIADSSKERPAVAILMPAHNEALVIAESIKSIKPQLRPQDRLVVVADNCTDETAAIVGACGATVIERFNQQNRGKGYALDFGLQYLKANAPAVVIIVDADCIVHENAIALLIAACVQSQRPIQALYLMESQPNPSLKARIAAFAWQVKNKVRPLGFKLLGLPCQLMGTGMAFLWDDISKVSLASGHIVEDMKLGTDLARLNKAPLFLQEALVTSVFPPSEAATNTQRARWEHGHLSVILNELPKLVLVAIKNKNGQMLGLACDLLIPPLAMLTLMCLTVTVASVLFADKVIVLLALSLLGCLLLAVLLAWVKFGREIISFKQLCYAPIYALVKIPLYLKFFMNRQVEWVRSKRD
jgi:cellulose synthase/poly-beta-1,6-N-acetylglucosamine synthase-like glycosyltransferase